MLTFLLFYLALYGGAHAYLLMRTARCFQLSALYCSVLAVVSIFMVIAPILVRVLERHRKERQAKLVAYLGYCWMGFFFLLLSASIALDLLRGVLTAAGWLLRRELIFSEGRLLGASLLLALAASVYGIFEARKIRVERVTLRSAKIPKSPGGVRVVLITDVHLGIMVGREGLKRILDKVIALQPDLLVSTGDLVDGQMDGLRGLEVELAAFKPPLGKYAVLGNHEVFAGVRPSADFTKSCGFQLLRQQSAVVGDFLTIVGVDDPALGERKEGADGALLTALPTGNYTILLKHRPKVENGAGGLFDLQLSGHVHKGQIFPFNLITHLEYPVKMGLSETKAGSLLYVSRGSGTWGPPMRVLAPPEVTVIDLLPA